MKAKIDFLRSNFKRVTSGSVWLPEVDGLRFFAIAWVVLFHLQGSFLNKTNIVSGENNFVFRILLGGDQGVFLFFVISGFVLCMPFAKHYLLNEKAVILSNYYWRRVVRIEPPYIIACLIIFVLLVIRSKYSWSELLPHLGASLIYLHSIIYHEVSLINVVFWSLEIEVQFYLLAPLMAFLYFKMSSVLRRVIVLILIILLPVIQTAMSGWPLVLPVVLQYFLMGFLICDLYISEPFIIFFKRNRFVGSFILVILLLVNRNESLLENVLLPWLMGSFFLFVLYNSFWKGIFSITWIAVIGGMCYSIYLIHFQIIAAIGDFSMRFTVGNNFYLNLFIQALLIVPFVLIISSVFYIAVEKPFMKMRWRKT